MNAYQHVHLHEWIAVGKPCGKIREVQTVVLAYCVDERVVLPWVVDVVTGWMTE